MNNAAIQTLLDDCSIELQEIEQIITVFKQTHSIVPYLTNYAVIKCCGTIEYSFKTIISEYHNSIPAQAKNYIDKTFTNSSMNPSKENICKSLRNFDSNWNDQFKLKLKNDPDSSQIESSLSSLNNARNNFAHGGHPNVSFKSVKQYFEDSKKVIEFLDDIIK